jgi:hypothetical protein
MQEEEWVYTIYAILNPKKGDIGYLFLDIRLYVVKELEILYKYIDLRNISSKEAAHTLPNPILVKYKINIPCAVTKGAPFTEPTRGSRFN